MQGKININDIKTDCDYYSDNFDVIRVVNFDIGISQYKIMFFILKLLVKPNFPLWIFF